MVINMDSKWEIILDDFIRDIKKRKYGKDEKLPTENEVAVHYGVSRNEVRMVYKKLKEMGYVYSIRGCGSFYSGNRIRIPLCLGRNAGFSEKMKEMGLNYCTQNVEAKPINYNANIYESLQISEDDIIWKIVLLRLVDNEPIAIHTRYLPQKLFPNLPQDAHSITSSRNYLKSNGYPQVYGKDTQMAVTPISHKKQELLHMRNNQEAMVLTSKTINKTDHGILELVSTIYRTDRFLFTFYDKDHC